MKEQYDPDHGCDFCENLRPIAPFDPISICEPCRIAGNILFSGQPFEPEHIERYRAGILKRRTAELS